MTRILRMAASGFLAIASALAPVVARADETPASAPAPSPAAVVPRLPPEVVEHVIQGAVQYLYYKQNPSGSWEKSDRPAYWAPMDVYEPSLNMNGPQYGGTTALVLFALLSAGENPQNARLHKTIEWLKKVELHGVYSVALRLNAFSLLPESTVRENMRADTEFLVQALIHPGKPGAGMYNYIAKPTGNRYDHSVSQYGVLGVWQGALHGFDPGENYWHAVESAWIRDQRPDGGWGYTQQPPTTGGMAAAGLATLFITQDYLHSTEWVDCKGNASNPAIERGLKWFQDNFRADADPGSPYPPEYYLFGCERVGTASGYKYFGNHDWYNEGATYLAHQQMRDGSFSAFGILTEIQTAAFAALFLARGRQPILFNKLRYSGTWNQRPRDVANITRWFGREYECELIWQIVDIDKNVDDFHDGPILYISGGDKLAFTDEQKDKLRQYAQGGGLILGVPDCQSPAFIDSFRQLQADLFPQYPARQLPEDHLIFTGYTKLTRPVELWGQNNGVRELTLLVPKEDLGRAYQTNQPAAVPYLFQVAANIGFYTASDPSALRHRDDPYTVPRDESITAKRTVKIARIQYDGNWDPEPGGWIRLANLLHNQRALDLVVEPVKLGEGALTGYKIAHITGTGTLVFGTEEARELRLFLARGGTLIVDAAGGSVPFAKSIEPQLNALISTVRLDVVPLEASILAEPAAADLPPKPRLRAFQNGPRRSATEPAEGAEVAEAPHDPLIEVAYRRFAKSRVGSGGLRLLGGKVGKRYLILFSPEDLSAGIVGQDTDGVVGYTPEVATEIMSRIIINVAAKLD